MLLLFLVPWAAFTSLCRAIYDSCVETFVLGSVPSLLPLISSTASSSRESVYLFQRRSYLLHHSGQFLWAPAVRFSRRLKCFFSSFFPLALLSFGELFIIFCSACCQWYCGFHPQPSLDHLVSSCGGVLARPGAQPLLAPIISGRNWPHEPTRPRLFDTVFLGASVP